MDESVKRADEAASLARQGKPDEAIVIFTDLISQATSSGQKSKLYTYRGHVYYLGKGERDRAISDFNEAIKQNPENADAFDGRGYVHLERGKYDLAIADYSRAVALGLSNVGVYTNRGNAYSWKGEYKRAVEDYNRAEELDPKNVSVYCNRGTAHAREGEYKKAITDLEKAIELNPDDVLTYVNLGNVYNGTGEQGKALAYYEEAIKRKPDYVLAYLNKAAIYYKGGEFDKELAVYNEAIAQAPKPIRNPAYALIYHRRALIYAATGDIAHAFNDYSEAIKLDSEYAPAYDGRGLLYHTCCRVAYLNGESQKAEQYFKKAKEDFEQAEAKGNISLQALEAKYIIDEVEGFSPGEKKNIYELHQRVLIIREKLFLGPVAVSHYCSLDTLKNLAENLPTDKNNFRLYNVDYMDDPEEGETFLEILNSYSVKHDLNVGQDFYKENEESESISPAYIGSFSQKDEELFMWRAYGKQDRIEASGARLTFKSCSFSSQLSPVLGTRASDNLYSRYPPHDFSANIQKTGEASASVSEVILDSPPDRGHPEPELFRVVYKGELEEGQELKGLLKELNKTLEGLAGKEKTHKLVRALLDEIRFLFKSDHYKEEKEARVIAMRYRDGDNGNPHIKVDSDEFPPKFYVEPFKGNVLEKVILGPQVKRGISEWQEMIKGSEPLKGVEVVKSGITYGKK